MSVCLHAHLLVYACVTKQLLLQQLQFMLTCMPSDMHTHSLYHVLHEIAIRLLLCMICAKWELVCLMLLRWLSLSAWLMLSSYM